MKKQFLVLIFCLAGLFLLGVRVFPRIHLYYCGRASPPRLQATLQKNILSLPYLHIVSLDSLPIHISDVVVNGRYRVFGFCNVVFDGKLDSLGIQRYKVELGEIFPRYSPHDEGYAVKLSALFGCGISGKDSLKMGESMNIGEEEILDTAKGGFEPIQATPTTVEIKTNRGDVVLPITLY